MSPMGFQTSLGNTFDFTSCEGVGDGQGKLETLFFFCKDFSLVTSSDFHQQKEVYRRHKNLEKKLELVIIFHFLSANKITTIISSISDRPVRL